VVAGTGGGLSGTEKLGGETEALAVVGLEALGAADGLAERSALAAVAGDCLLPSSQRRSASAAATTAAQKGQARSWMRT